MAKKIDLNKTVYELTNEYPELVDIMVGLGFKEITNKAMLNSVGRLTTIPKGAKMHNISMMDVVTVLMSNGFELVGKMPTLSPSGEMKGSLSKEKITIPVESAPVSRKEQLKDYLRRLGTGEALESVREDFVRNFSDVDASEIMEAEQELMKEGTPLTEVQKLCDVHSALFHGATAAEIHAAERKEVSSNGDEAESEKSDIQKKIAAEYAKRDSYPQKDYTDKNARAAAMSETYGHPLYTFTKENEALKELLNRFRETGEEELISKIRDLSIHYAKKGDLLYPHLKVKYGVSGPSDVMWTVDDEIRDELGALAKIETHDDEWIERLNSVLVRADEMIYKEQNILFPICAVNFTDEEWYGIYRDSKDYSVCFGVENFEWHEAEKAKVEDRLPQAGEIVMPGGCMTLPQLIALLNTMPIEISFIDADNINRYFNEGSKVFKRPGMALGRDVFSCHPPKIEPMVRAILDDFRSGLRDSVPVWMEKNGRSMYVIYMAVRDKEKNYLGTVELVQDMEFAKEHFQR